MKYKTVYKESEITKSFKIHIANNKNEKDIINNNI